MCKRRFPGALQTSGSCVHFVIQCQRLRSRLSLSRCTVEAGLRKCRHGRFSSLPVPASSVSDERGSTPHLRPASLRPHLRRTHQPPLASAQERVRFKTAVLMYKATHGTAPSYQSQLVRVADLPGRHSLHSARTNRLLVLSVKLSTVGRRAFPVAGPTICNSLPDSVISSPSLSTFRQRLKTYLFQASFPDVIIDPVKLFPYLQWTLKWLYYLDHS